MVRHVGPFGKAFIKLFLLHVVWNERPVFCAPRGVYTSRRFVQELADEVVRASYSFQNKYGWFCLPVGT